MTFDAPFHLRVIHFNDLHGRLADVTVEGISPVFSRIAGFIRRARQACAGRSDAGVLVLSGGDDLLGSPFGELVGTCPEQFRCHPAYQLYSAAGVDASAIGNHELDWGLSLLSMAAVHDARFPVLSANLTALQSRGVKPWTVITLKGLRVGLIGLTTQSEIKHIFPGEFEIIDPLPAVLDLLPVLQAQTDIVIVLSHLGHAAGDPIAVEAGIRDVELAAALPKGAVPVIVGSHTHNVLNENGLDGANIVNGTLLTQAGGHGRYLGEILIDVGDGQAQVVDARLWRVESLPEDPEFEQAHVLPIARSVQRLVAEPVGRVTPHEDLDWVRVRTEFARRELALANFVTDALVACCRTSGFPIDFFMLDSSGLCDGLPQGGTLTFGDLFRLSPFGDSIALVRVPAQALKALLDDNARRMDLPGEEHEERGFVQFSREVRYRIEGGGPTRRERSSLVAAGATINGRTARELAETGQDDLLVGCSSFVRQFAVLWERKARGRGLPVFDLNTLPHEVTRLALREQLIAHVRQVGGVTLATGLSRDGRLAVASRLLPQTDPAVPGRER